MNFWVVSNIGTYLSCEHTERQRQAANAGLWWRLKIGPRPIPKRHNIYANTSGNTSIDIDTQRVYTLKLHFYDFSDFYINLKIFHIFKD